MIKLFFGVIVSMFILSACSVTPERPVTKSSGGAYYQDDGPPLKTDVDLESVDEVVPRQESRSRTGNAPYTVFGQRYYPTQSADGYREIGEASWYGKKFHGRTTSSGEIYDMYKMTAAHKTLPLPTYVRVRRLDTDVSVVVRVNDRGPFLKGRIIDLSYIAARKIGLVERGTAKVEVTSISIKNEQAIASKSGVFFEAARFRLPENAENLSARLRKLNIGSVDIFSENIGELVYYRVRVGPISKDQELNDYISKIRSVSGRLHRMY